MYCLLFMDKQSPAQKLICGTMETYQDKGGIMGRIKDYYIEYHTLEFDIINSDCGKCEFLHDCKHYTKEGCPHAKD